MDVRREHRENGVERTQPYFEVRTSGIHGRGAFAVQRILAGTRIVEYTGEAVTPAEADRRYADRDDPHTFLFTLSRRRIIDAGVGGNEARFINHSCEPNCQAFIERGRIFIEALREIAPGEELGYDYRLQLDTRVTRTLREKYVCRCGSPECRGTMLELPKRKTRTRTPGTPARKKGRR